MISHRNLLTLPGNSIFTPFDTTLVRRQTDVHRPAVWTYAGAGRRVCSVSDRSEGSRKVLLSHRRTPPERTRLDRGTSVWPSLRAATRLAGFEHDHVLRVQTDGAALLVFRKQILHEVDDGRVGVVAFLREQVRHATVGFGHQIV